MIFIIVVFHFILQIRAFIASSFDVRKAILSGIISRGKNEPSGGRRKMLGRFIAAMIDKDCDDPFIRFYRVFSSQSHTLHGMF